MASREEESAAFADNVLHEDTNEYDEEKEQDVCSSESEVEIDLPQEQKTDRTESEDEQPFEPVSVTVSATAVSSEQSKWPNIDSDIKSDTPNQLSSSDPVPSDDGGNKSNNAVSSSSYIEPVMDPYEKATKFLEKHQLLMLAQTLTADIVLNRPADPLEFMISEIEKLQELDRVRKGVFLKINKQDGNTAETKQGDRDDIVATDFDKPT